MLNSWQMTDDFNCLQLQEIFAKRSASRAASAVLQCLQFWYCKNNKKIELNFKDWQYQWMKLNGIEWNWMAYVAYTWHIRLGKTWIWYGIAPLVLTSRKMALIKARPWRRGLSWQNRPPVSQQNQIRTYFRTYMMIFKSGWLLMIINDYQDASCCLIKNDQYIYICLRFYSVKTVDAFHDQYICLVFSLKNGEDHGKIMGIIVNVDGKKSPPWSRSIPAAQEPFGSPRTAVQTGSFVLYKRNGTTTAVWTQHSQIFSDIPRYSQHSFCVFFFDLMFL